MGISILYHMVLVIASMPLIWCDGRVNCVIQLSCKVNDNHTRYHTEEMNQPYTHCIWLDCPLSILILDLWVIQDYLDILPASYLPETILTLDTSTLDSILSCLDKSDPILALTNPGLSWYCVFVILSGIKVFFVLISSSSTLVKYEARHYIKHSIWCTRSRKGTRAWGQAAECEGRNQSGTGESKHQYVSVETRVWGQVRAGTRMWQVRASISMWA